MMKRVSVRDLVEGFKKNPVSQQFNGITGYLDKAMEADKSNFDNNYNRLMQNIKAFNRSNSFICPETPTCAGLINASFFCSNGIENDIKVTTTPFCEKRYSLELMDDNTMALPVPANGVFADQSASITNPTSTPRECLLVETTSSYTYYEMKGKDCIVDTDNACYTLVDHLVEDLAKKHVKKFRTDIFTAVNASAITVAPSSGDIVSNIEKLYNALADNPKNQGKKIIIYVNPSIIRKILSSREQNGRHLTGDFMKIGSCPVTSCMEYCLLNYMTIKEVESTLAPIATGTGVTTMTAIVVDHVHGWRSEVEIVEKSWRDNFTSMNDLMGSFQSTGVGIFNYHNTAVSAKMSITI